MVCDFPAHWRHATLREVCDVLDKQRVALNQQERRRKPGDIPYWGANGIIDYIDDFIFNEPLILMAEDGGHFDNRHATPICHLLNGKTWVNNHAHILRARPGVVREWVYYWLIGQDMTPHVNTGTRAKLNLKALHNIPIAVPPVREQNAVVAVIQGVERVVEVARAEIAQLERVKRSLLSHLFTHGMHPLDGRKTEVGDVPAGWHLTTLGHTMHSMKGGGTPSKKQGAYWGGEIPWASVKDLRGPFLGQTQACITAEGLRDSSARLIPEGSLVVATRMAVGRASMTTREIAINQDLRAIRFKPTMDTRFMYQWFQFQAPRWCALGAGTTVPGIRQEVLQGLPIHVPPLSEQRAMAAMLFSLDETIQASQAALQRLCTLKRGVMSDLLTGRVRLGGSAP